MNVKEMAEQVGKTGVLRTEDGLKVAIRITDARKSYGDVQYEVEPIAGSGRTWVGAVRVTLS